MDYTIWKGDARRARSVIPEGTQFDLLVTSPPYNIGEDYEDYITSMEHFWEVIREVFVAIDPFIKPFGKVAINFADRYANSKYLKKVCEISYVPDYIYIMEDLLGYDLWARIIWDKMARIMDKDRHLTSKGRWEGSMRVSPNWEHIYVWRKPGKGKLPVKKIEMTRSQWKEYVDGIWEIKTKRGGNKFTGASKVAPFPIEIPRRLIDMYTERGDNVIDPFLGTGTTIKAALQRGRNAFGFELYEETINFAVDRLEDFNGTIIDID